MSNIIAGRPSDATLLARMGPDLYREAYTHGRSLSAHLEHLSPSDPGDLDAFSRLMREAGIRSASLPESGFWASEFREFEATEQTRALVPEWISRQWRRAVYGPTQSRALYSSADDIPGSLMRPYAEATTGRVNGRIMPAIPLAALLALTTPIDSNVYRAYYLTQSATEARMVRVGESAVVPEAKLTGAEQSITLKKYGRTLTASYEALRRMRLDKVALYIELLAAQTEVDKVATVIDVLVNGDGNSNGAAVSNLTTLDSAATAGTLTLKGWLAFKMLFADPYVATVALTTSAVALQAKLLNVGSANVPATVYAAQGGFGMFRDLNTGLADGTALGWTSAAPTLKIVALDASMAVEQVVEIGANIEEIERYARKQTQSLVMTETLGYAIIDSSAAKILDVNA